MLAIQGLKCVYDTGAHVWAMELAFVGEETPRRFDLDGPEDAEMLIDAFEGSSSAVFDATSGEIVFAYEYARFDHEDGDDKDKTAEDESEEDEDGEDEEDAHDGHKAHHDEDKKEVA